MSRGFRCALTGVGVTIFAWFSPWLWPAWPAFGLLDLLFSNQRPFSALAPEMRATVAVFLIAFNVAAWSFVSLLAWRVVTFRPRQRAPSSPD